MKIIQVILTLAFLLSTITYAKEYVVVMNKASIKLSPSQIKAIFLKKNTFINGIKFIPINLDSRNKIRSSFETKILKMHFNRLKSYWNKQHYLGKRPPISMHSQTSIKNFLSKVTGSIGYIEKKNMNDNLYIIHTWSD